MSDGNNAIEDMLKSITQHESIIENCKRKIDLENKAISEAYESIATSIEDGVNTGDALKDECLLKGKEWRVYYNRLRNFQKLCTKHQGQLLMVYWTEKTRTKVSWIGDESINQLNFSIGVIGTDELCVYDTHITLPTKRYINNNNNYTDDTMYKVESGYIYVSTYNQVTFTDSVKEDKNGVLFGGNSILKWWQKNIRQDSSKLYEICLRLDIQPPMSPEVELSVKRKMKHMLAKLAHKFKHILPLSLKILNIPDTAWISESEDFQDDEIPELSEFIFVGKEKEEVCCILNKLKLYGVQHPLLIALENLYLPKKDAI